MDEIIQYDNTMPGGFRNLFLHTIKTAKLMDVHFKIRRRNIISDLWKKFYGRKLEKHDHFESL